MPYSCPAAVFSTAQANVKEPRFGLDYIKNFDIVLNGLDNMDARRHVNRWGQIQIQTADSNFALAVSHNSSTGT